MRVNSASPSDWTVDVSPLNCSQQLEDEWCDLQTRADCSYFQSWGWVRAWATGAQGAGLQLLRIARGERPVALAIIGRRLLRRHKLVPSRALLLFESGSPAFDAVTMEHNGMIIERGVESEALEHALRSLSASRLKWDELLVSAIDESSATTLARAARNAGMHAVSRYSKPTFTVSIERLRKKGGDVFSDFSSNTRQQIRRAIRGYESHGEITVTEARTLEQAQEYLAELRKLHAAHWNGKGVPSAFVSDFGVAFHDGLVASRFAHGEIQMLRVSAGTLVLGYLYNLVLGATVYNYQSGFAYDTDAKLKPGLVCHVKTIAHLVGGTAVTYDLLMGEQRYKRSLAHDESRMLWLAIHRHRLRSALDCWSGAKPVS
jgi:CelD/BcsL family acetyltransferase involved in cellulose biosynthesis